MWRWTDGLPVTAVFCGVWATEAWGDRVGFSVAILIGIVAGVGWFWLAPVGFAKKAWLWVLYLAGVCVAGAVAGQLEGPGLLPGGLAVLGVVGGHLVAERFAWQRRPATATRHELIG
ncbi:hypothetical protein ACLM5J_03735 [Nocardioides sp. Bht2]|uniref:hypothetical protein n=1 Tax=Nocardioides sp. Bht2 TaxID=3392297 RepID=UPI0039B6B06F